MLLLLHTRLTFINTPPLCSLKILAFYISAQAIFLGVTMFQGTIKYFYIIFFILLTACGGGGGSSNSVSVAGSNTPTLEMQTTIGGSQVSNSKDVVFSFAGDVGSLAGKTIYIALDIPTNDIYGNIYGYTIDTVNKKSTISFDNFQAPKLPAGVYQYNLGVKFCYDSACNSQIAGSPYKLPLKFTILPGITVSQETLNLTSTFGSKPSPVSIDFTLPEGSGIWGVDCTSSDIPLNSTQPVTAKYSISDYSLRSFTIEGQQVSPGNYTSTCTISTYAPSASTGYSNSMRVEKKITVNYAIADSNIAAVFSKSEIVENVLYCVNNFTYHANVLKIQGANSLKLVGIEYLSEPAEHTPSSEYYRSWISNTLGTEYMEGYDIGIITQQSRSGAWCLPNGEYKARLKYQSGSGDSLREVYFPVTLIFNKT